MLANIIDCFNGHKSKFCEAAFWLLLFFNATLSPLKLFLFRFFDYWKLRHISEFLLYVSFSLWWSITLFLFKSFCVHSLHESIFRIFDLFHASQVPLNLTNRHLLILRKVIKLRSLLCIVLSCLPITTLDWAVGATLCISVLHLLFLVTKSISHPQGSNIGHFIYTN